MDNIFNYLLESGISLAIFYLFYRVLYLERAPFTASRIYLIGSLLFSTALPFMDFSLGGGSNFFIFRQVVMEPVSVTLQESAIHQRGTPSVLFYLYLLGSAILFSMLFYRIWRIISMRRRGKVIRYERYAVISLEEDIPPFSFFNQIFIPRSELKDSIHARFILTHERVHIKSYHSLDNLLVGTIALFQWFNPFIWMMQKELKKVHEYEADRRTIAKTGNYKAYQALLFHQAFGVPYLLPVNNFNSSIKKRLLMLRKTSSSADLFRGFIFIPLVIALIFFFACSETENSDTSAQDKTEVAKSKAKKASKDDQVFVVVEEMPKFRGEDVAAFRQYIQQQVSYPEEAAEKGLEGTSFVRFIVNKQGEVENVKVVRSTYPIFGETAAEAIRNAPTWEPGKQRGQKVRVQFTIPVVFKLKE